MDEFRRNLTILALNNLIDDYNYILEEANLDPEIIDFMQICIKESKSYIEELLINVEESTIEKPVWNQQ